MQVIRIATISPLSLGLNVDTTLRVTGNVGPYDRMILTKTSCTLDDIIAGSAPRVFDQNTTTRMALQELHESMMVCLSVKNGPVGMYFDTGKRLQVRKAQVTRVDVRRVVKDSTVMYTLQGKSCIRCQNMG